MSSPFLSVRGVGKHFQGLHAVENVSFDVTRGEEISIIGPNGAGKTTLFNLLTGQLAPTSGEIRLNDQVLNQLRPDKRAKLGLGRTFQIAKPLIGLSALENAMVGAFLHHRALRDAEERAWQSSIRSACENARTSGRVNSPCRNAAGWRSPGPSRWSLRSSCSMRSWPGSIRAK